MQGQVALENPDSAHRESARLHYLNWSRILLAAALLLLAWISAWPVLPPAVVPASAATDGFSAERAMEDLRIVAAEPHGAGSAAQFRIRDYILAEAAAIGLTGEVQKSGRVENVIVRLPGTASTRDLLITGHYDSHPPAPGAGDDGISVATMLETMRVLSAGPALRNDIVFLFADGEELGYLGSLAYIREFRQAKENVGVVLCFDARPGNAPLTLRETAPGDGWLIREFAASRPALLVTSWLNGEERGEIDTDCSQFIAGGYLGVEIENEARGTRYHTPADTVDAISPRLVQAFGVTMERSARHFGNLDLSAAQRTRDVAFFTVPLVGIVIYPTWLIPAIAMLATVAFVGLSVLAWRHKHLSLVRGLLGALALLVAIVLIILLATLLWNLLLDRVPVTEEATLHYLDFEGSTGWKIGIMTGALLLGLAALVGLSRYFGAVSLTAGGNLVFLVVLWLAYYLLDSDNPATTPHIAWPLLGGVAGLAILVLVRHRTWMPVWLFLAAIPIFVLIIPMLGITMLQMSDGPWVPVLVISLVLGLFVPQIAFIAGRLPSGSAD